MAGLLAGTTYDPVGGVVSKATDTLIAMTAVDTTNLRLTFTAPANGKVMVKLKCTTTGATTYPRILLGVLDGATVRLRMSPIGATMQAAASTMLMGQEVLGLVTGLTPGNSYTFDAAYGVEVVIASTNIKYGGPDDASGADAYGGFVFEIWDTTHLLAGLVYDPTSSSTAVSGSATKALTAIDTTNCRLTFTTNASGLGSTQVFWRVRTQFHGSGTTGSWLLGVLDGATIKARVAPTKGAPQTSAATSCEALEASGVITGLTPSTSYTWDAAAAVQVVSGGGGVRHGGPNNTTTNDAQGGTAFEVWGA